MARKDTVNALIRRGVSAKVSEAIANANFKIGDLRKTPFELITKFISEEDAEDLLEKIGAKKINMPDIAAAPKAKAAPKEKAKKLGIRGYLMKPIIKKDLANAVRKVLDGHIDTPDFNSIKDKGNYITFLYAPGRRKS